MDFIKRTVSRLTSIHKTNDPFEIASLRDILVFYEDLGEVFGYYNTFKRIHMIHINQFLDKNVQRFVVAHELGHSILHSKISTPFMKQYTLFSVDRIEREANRFAVEMLLPDDLLLDGCTLYEAAAICGVPKEVARLKKLPRRFY
ncbi:ImmA/IrrE family metallo-endopeptidase [Paenibacillus sp. NAIST15-1]|uniref:ImmA/IrrE family metallo-endopeptidase n=1 Tax=Paenibacillus sp. NAIST15-1 TaxID=1605994 RepID=UPI000869C642|nr:ImmA/IrrE family metallo-endopeptidase [Paenibacillus sp. NAIST15-1]GAV13267.1 hypothetical protein PBN151_3201 [Paenibacillus sp. NAIST15-1]